jgi:hypothetical protein
MWSREAYSQPIKKTGLFSLPFSQSVTGAGETGESSSRGVEHEQSGRVAVAPARVSGAAVRRTEALGSLARAEAAGQQRPRHAAAHRKRPSEGRRGSRQAIGGGGGQAEPGGGQARPQHQQQQGSKHPTPGHK